MGFMLRFVIGQQRRKILPGQLGSSTQLQKEVKRPYFHGSLATHQQTNKGLPNCKNNYRNTCSFIQDLLKHSLFWGSVFRWMSQNISWSYLAH